MGVVQEAPPRSILADPHLQFLPARGRRARRASEIMLRFILKRLLLAIPTLIAVLTVVFVLVRVVPGDPTIVILGDQASAQARADLRAKLGIDRPIAVQYLDFMGQVARGDLGRSLTTNRPIMEDVAHVLPYTIELTLAALLIGTGLGVPLGVMAARNRDGFADWFARIFSLAGVSFPAFVSGILLLLVFAVYLRWFPVISTPRGTGFGERLGSLILPALNLGLLMVAYVTRVTRSGMLKVLGDDYIRTARAKGMPGRVVVWRHALRNVLVPVVTVVGLYLGVLIGNAVLTEIVFNRPGLGKLIVTALNQRDYSLLQGLMVVSAFAIVLANVVTDITYGLVDPRVSAG